MALLDDDELLALLDDDALLTLLDDDAGCLGKCSPASLRSLSSKDLLVLAFFEGAFLVYEETNKKEFFSTAL